MGPGRTHKGRRPQQQALLMTPASLRVVCGLVRPGPPQTGTGTAGSPVVWSGLFFRCSPWNQRGVCARLAARRADAGRATGLRIGISGAHGTGKTTLAEDLCVHLAGHVPVDEPYFLLLEEEGYEFEYPPSLDNYRAQFRQVFLRVLRSPAPRVVFDRTPLDFLAYLAVPGADIEDEADPSALR